MNVTSSSSPKEEEKRFNSKKKINLRQYKKIKEKQLEAEEERIEKETVTIGRDNFVFFWKRQSLNALLFCRKSDNYCSYFSGSSGSEDMEVE